MNILLTLLLILSCHAEERNSNTYYYPNGLKVTPVEREWHPLEAVLDIKIWEFHVELPEPKSNLYCDVELREEGKPAKVLLSHANILFRRDRKTHTGRFAFALVPMRNGQIAPEILKALEAKIQVSISGGSEGKVIPSPFYNAGAIEYPNPVLPRSGDIHLATIHLDSPRGSKQPARYPKLFLKFSARPFKDTDF